MKCYLDRVEALSVDFREAEVDGTRVITRAGRLGDKGNTTTIAWASAAEAKSHYEQLLAQHKAAGFKDASPEVPEHDKVTHYLEKRCPKPSQFIEMHINDKTLTRRTGCVGDLGETQTFKIGSIPQARRLFSVFLQQAHNDGYTPAQPVAPQPYERKSAYLESTDHRRFFEITEFNNRMTIRRGEVGKPCIVFDLSWVNEGRGRQNFERLVSQWKKLGFKAGNPSQPIVEGCRATEIFSDEIQTHREFGQFFNIGSASEMRGQVIRIAYFPNGLQYDGDFDLECVADMDLFDGLIVKGDVRVTGVFSQLTYTYPGSILILGSVYAHSLGQADSHMVIRGDVNVENIVYGHYNDGSLQIIGNVTGRLWYSYDHDMSASGSYRIHRLDWGETEGLSPKVCTLGGGVDEELIRQRMFERKSPMKPGWVLPVVSPPVPVIEEPEVDDVLAVDTEAELNWKPPEAGQVEDEDAIHPRINRILDLYAQYDPAAVYSALEADHDRELIRLHSAWLLLPAIDRSADVYVLIVKRLLELGADPRIPFDGDPTCVIDNARNRQRREVLAAFQAAFPELDCELKDEEIVYKEEVLQRLIELEDSHADFTDPSIRAELDQIYQLQVVVKTLARIPEAIGELRNLVSITLYAISPECLAIPSSILRLTQLQKLRLNDSGWTSLPDLSSMPSLHTVDLAKNKLRAIPALPKGIETLTLSYNPLKSVDLSAYPQLRSVSLDGVVASVHGLGCFATLTNLSWADAQWKAIPESILQCASLKSLNLKQNKMTEMPDVSGMTSLEHLDLSYGPLKTLHDSMLQLPKLRSLNLHQCPKLEKAFQQEGGGVRRIVDALRAKGVEVTLINDTGSETKKAMGAKERKQLKAIKSLNKEASGLQTQNAHQALDAYEQVISVAKPLLADFADAFSYDLLFAMQGKLWCVNELILASSEQWRADNARSLAQDILEFTGSKFNFYYSEAGELSRSAKVLAHNSLAYYGSQSAQDRSQMEQALAHADAAIAEIDYDSPVETYSAVLQNKLELLLKLDRSDEAYAVVCQMNRKHPGVDFFESLAKTPGYEKWDAQN